MSSKLIDLSHEVEHRMITYKRLPAPLICDFHSRAESRKHYATGTEFNYRNLVDSPFHALRMGSIFQNFH